MQLRLVVSIVTPFLFSFACASTPIQQQQRFNEELLKSRTKSYYATLQMNEFDKMWNFLAPGAREDTSPSEHARNLASFFGGTRVQLLEVRKALVTEKHLSGGVRKFGECLAVLAITDLDSKKVSNVEHGTTWIWQEQFDNWYLVREDSWQLAKDYNKFK